MPRKDGKRNQKKMHQLVVRHKVGKKNMFEIMVNAGMVDKYKKGLIPLSEVLVVPLVFKNARKAEQATPKELSAAFGTANIDAVAKIMLEKGGAQKNSTERKGDTETKMRALCEYVHKNFRDARNKLPLSMVRIRELIRQSGFSMNTANSLSTESRKFITLVKKKALQPIVRNEIVTEIKFPLRQMGPVYSLIEKMECSIHSRSRADDFFVLKVGCLNGELDDFIKAFNKAAGEEMKKTKKLRKVSRRQKAPPEKNEHEDASNRTRRSSHRNGTDVKQKTTTRRTGRKKKRA
mmetsp:Transcript_15778/g.23768  ORF Transcript_15778/g.23768 Transcript_15778/m.23768 type:complete len:292 (+) Transcript_15778:149-1024(+)|eukprot:CAMPEP_0167747190 /NCGR_PEP_ID=MMETSP0110_2-20121227/4144_1 /TAXON_ID=629695 /ORGANISM="Gymnochlora sp., Strain CCMP2014" /LENGTH=291 /DNA_ID=CAMNT_0007632065 /DNA_START=99 /DNA_END=974 /DNA_ORIENTATION=+